MFVMEWQSDQEERLSKKPASLKVHQLAKELGVSSKDIVTRCQSEDIPDIVNHLSSVSIGLAMTVREWFAGAAGAMGAGTTGDHAGDASNAGTSVAHEPAVTKTPSGSSVTATGAHGVGGGGFRTTNHSAGSSAVADGPHGDEQGQEQVIGDADTTPHPIAKRATKKVATAPTAAPAEPIRRRVSLEATQSPLSSTPALSAPPALDIAHGVDSGVESASPEQSVQRAAAAGLPAGETPTSMSSNQMSSTPVSSTPVSSTATKSSQLDRSNIRLATPAVVAPAPIAPTAPPSLTPSRAAAMRVPAGLTSRQQPRMDGSTPAGAKPVEKPQVVARRVITAPPPPPASISDAAGSSPVMNVPTRPSIVGPVGPQLGSREKTRLSGPQVIRVEQADNLPTPPPMRRTGPGGTASPGGYGSSGGSSGGARGRTGGATGTGGAGRTGARGGIGASRTGRAGESARMAIGAQDIRDRQARLDASRGFMSQHRPAGGRMGFGGTGGGQRTERKPGEVQQIHVAEPLTIKELSAATGIKATDIIKKLFLGGTMATINGGIDREKAIDIMMEFDIDLIVDEAKSAADIIEARFKDRPRTDERRRAPIVTILGHVDHGKTSLLDRIRSTNIAAGEAGGITQSTRAFCVPVKAGDIDRMVTFIDTPGHEAFTAMRARGAKVTDIVVLVVSAVDGCMPQTIESINHAKAAGVPIVVALNKIDRPDANEASIRRVLGQLAEHELNPVEWGGTTEVIKTSATRGDGIQELIEILDYQAELLELKADFDGFARGTVLEASIEEGRGPVARVMVQEGRLKKGDFIVIGRGYGRVRDIINDRGERITEAFPSTPVAISGIDELPDAGDKAFVVESIRAAEEAAEERRRIDRERELATPKITLDNIFKHLEKQGRKELALVVKGDVQGSVEALKGMLGKLPTEEVTVSVKSASAGGINESDVSLAAATNAIVVGFNVTSSSKARQLAEAKGVEIRL